MPQEAPILKGTILPKMFHDSVWDKIRTVVGMGSSGSITTIQIADGSITEAKLADGSVTDIKLHADVKVGSLATLTTTEQGSVVGAINEVVASIPPNTFVGLSDSPGAYATNQTKGIRVNDAGTGLVYYIRELIALVDFPNSYTGQTGKHLRVKTDESGVEFVAAPTSITTFLGLTDTPSTYSGNGLKGVRVNGGATSLEFYDALTATSFTTNRGVYATGPFGLATGSVYDSGLGRIGLGVADNSSQMLNINAGSITGITLALSSVGTGIDINNANTGAGNAIEAVSAGTSPTINIQNTGSGQAAGFSNTGSSTNPTVRIASTHSGADLAIAGAVVYEPARAINANLTLTGRHRYVQVSTSTAAVTLTLPSRAAWNDGIEYMIEDVDGNVGAVGRAITLNTVSSQVFINTGATSATLNTPRALWRVIGTTDTAGTRKWTIYKHTIGA